MSRRFDESFRAWSNGILLLVATIVLVFFVWNMILHGIAVKEHPAFQSWTERLFLLLWFVLAFNLLLEAGGAWKEGARRQGTPPRPRRLIRAGTVFPNRRTEPSPYPSLHRTAGQTISPLLCVPPLSGPLRGLFLPCKEGLPVSSGPPLDEDGVSPSLPGRHHLCRPAGIFRAFNGGSRRSWGWAACL